MLCAATPDKERLTLVSECTAMNWFKKYDDSRGSDVHYERVLKKISGSPSRGSGLSQSEIAGNEKHYHYNTNDVKNIVHVSFSFLSRTGLPWSQMPIAFSERASERPSVVVLPSDAAP